jgi:hypothetical protein
MILVGWCSLLFGLPMASIRCDGMGTVFAAMRWQMFVDLFVLFADIICGR